MAINAGYMGLAQIGSQKIRFADGSISAKQEVTVPDLVMGDYDRDSFYYGAITIDGSLSGPIDTAFGTSIWNWVVNRDACGLLTAEAIDIWYYCGDGTNHLSIPQALANNMTITATAGDVANFSVDVVGAAQDGNEPVFDSETPPTDDEIRKLITWDAMDLTMTGNDGITGFDTALVSAFELTVANNVTPVYSLNQTNLFPADLITGLRQVSGSITVYNVGIETFGALDAFTGYGTGTGSVTFTVGGLTVSADVKWHRINPTSSPGPITSTIAFTGVGPQFRT